MYRFEVTSRREVGARRMKLPRRHFACRIKKRGISISVFVRNDNSLRLIKFLAPPQRVTATAVMNFDETRGKPRGDFAFSPTSAFRGELGWTRADRRVAAIAPTRLQPRDRMRRRAGCSLTRRRCTHTGTQRHRVDAPAPRRAAPSNPSDNVFRRCYGDLYAS